MPIRPPGLINPRPDNTSAFVGSEGDVIQTQEGGIKIGGEVDVGDRVGRNVGKFRLMDEAEALISQDNPFPTSVETWNGGVVTVTDDGSFDMSISDPVTIGTWDAGALTVDTALNPLSPSDLPLSVEEQNALEIGTWNAGQIETVTPNASGAYTDSHGQGESFAEHSVPDEYTVAYKGNPGNEGVVQVDGFPLGAGEGVELDVDDVSAVTTSVGTSEDTIHAIVEDSS